MDGQLIRRPKKLSLYKALKLGYLRNEKKQAKRLKRFGYIIDTDLTNNERMVAYNPLTHKVIFVSNGSETNPITHPLQFTKDWSHNILGIGTNKFNETIRYKQEEQAYNKTREKYKDAKVVLVGHSQSGNTVSSIVKPTDSAITLDPAIFNQKPKQNVHNFRVEGDIVSAFANDVKTLPNPIKSITNPFQPHDIENIKNQPIFI